jgi:hypothetical protein
MKKRHSAGQIVSLLRQADLDLGKGMTVPDVCRRLGMNNMDPTFDDCLEKTYDDALGKGFWTGNYASVNHHEYFDEGVQSWFDDNRVDDRNHVHTRSQLEGYDPSKARTFAWPDRLIEAKRLIREIATNRGKE